MTDPLNPCKIVLDKELANDPLNPVTPLERLRCRRWTAVMQAVMEIVKEGSLVWRIPIGPWPEPEPDWTSPDEVTTIPSIRDLLINEVILDALKNPSFGQGLFDDIQLSDVYTDALRGVIDELDATTKNLRAKLHGLERR